MNNKTFITLHALSRQLGLPAAWIKTEANVLQNHLCAFMARTKGLPIATLEKMASSLDITTIAAFKKSPQVSPSETIQTSRKINLLEGSMPISLRNTHLLPKKYWI